VEPTDLIIEKIILCSDVRSADDYDLQLDSTYVRGQAVYIYCDFYGATCSKKNSQYEIHIELAKLALFGPEGHEVASKVDVSDFRETSPTILRSSSLWVYFEAPLLGPIGDYFAEVTIRDVPSGNTAMTRASFTVKDGPLNIEHLRLCSAIRGVRDYTIQPDSAYQLGDRVWVYFELPGISVGGVEGEHEIWVKVSRLKVYDPQGRLLVNVADVLSEHFPYELLGGIPYLYLWLDIGEDWIIGQYRVEVTVEDGWTGGAVTESFNFSVK